jgi:general secretion pathway protein F
VANSEPLSISLRLDQLIALNDEIAALARAGVPLERGLAQLGGDMPGRLGQFTTLLASRMERGESLAAILNDPAVQLPAVYRAVVIAGLTSGRLPAALETVAGAARRLAESRRMVFASLIYPIVVLLVGWAGFVLYAALVAPRVLPAAADMGTPLVAVFAVAARWGDSAVWWAWTLPAAVFVLAAVWWLCSGRASILGPSRAGRMFGWLPWIGRAHSALRIATFADLLALLVEHDVALHDAVLLAGEASGDPRLERAASRLAEGLRRGEPLDLRRFEVRLPPVLQWLIGSGQSGGALLRALRRAADMYRRHAERYALSARIFLPVLLLLAIGGTATLTYALVVLVPWYSILYRLSELPL